MKSILRYIFLAAFTLSFTHGYCQREGKSNFVKISTAYAKYMSTKNYVNHKDWVLIINTSIESKDSIWFEITIKPTSKFINLKYTKVYKLNGYKLVIDEGFDSNKILTYLFHPAPFENFNKGKAGTVGYENFQRWYFLMNKKYEVVSAHSAMSIEEITNILKRNKVKLAKNFK
jgi:hypothetical protein